MGKLATGRGNLVRQVEMLRALGVQPTKRLPRQLTQRAEDVGIFEELTTPESADAPDSESQ
jgi:DNA recombination protein RmuC